MPWPEPVAARRLAGRPLLAGLALVALLVPGSAAAQAALAPQHAALFETAWGLVATRYWHLERTGVDWDAVKEEYLPRAVAATDSAALYAVLEEMYALLGDQHSVFVPPPKVERVRAEYGDLPCIMVLGNGAGSGEPRAPDAFGAGAAGWPLLRAAAPTLTDEGRIANVTYGLTQEGVGYLRLPDLASAGAAEAVRAAVAALEASGAWSFALDLRGNPGGRLVTMMQVAGVFTSGFLWRTVTDWMLPIPYPAIGLSQTALPLAVLIDQDVNSAAEGLAGALQLKERAVIVGQTSAGNVEAVLPFCLRDGSQAWIATGVLAPIGGPTWEGRGVVPDIEAPPAEALDAAVTYLLERRGSE